MSSLGVSMVILGTISALEFGFSTVAQSHITEVDESDGVLDSNLILRTCTSIIYDRQLGYPIHCLLDRDLFLSIQGALFSRIGDKLTIMNRQMLDQSMLLRRDRVHGLTISSPPCFLVNMPKGWWIPLPKNLVHF